MGRERESLRITWFLHNVLLIEALTNIWSSNTDGLADRLVYTHPHFALTNSGSYVWVLLTVVVVCIFVKVFILSLH